MSFLKQFQVYSPNWPSQPPVPSGAPCHGGPDDVLRFQGSHLKTGMWEALHLRTSAMVFSNRSINYSYLFIYLSVHCGSWIWEFYSPEWILSTSFYRNSPHHPSTSNQVWGAPRQDVLLDVQSWYWPTGHHNLNSHPWVDMNNSSSTYAWFRDMRWDLQIPTILRSISFSTCHQCHSQCSLQNTLAELSHSDHLGTLSKDCSRELQATGNWELAMPWGFFHAEFWDLRWYSFMPWFQSAAKNGYMQPSTYIIRLYLPSTCQSMPIYLYLPISTCQSLMFSIRVWCVRIVQIMGHTFQRMGMCSWVTWGGL